MTNPRFNSTHSAPVSDRRMWLGQDIAAIEARVTLYHVEGTQDHESRIS